MKSVKNNGIGSRTSFHLKKSRKEAGQEKATVKCSTQSCIG